MFAWNHAGMSIACGPGLNSAPGTIGGAERITTSAPEASEWTSERTGIRVTGHQSRAIRDHKALALQEASQPREACPRVG